MRCAGAAVAGVCAVLSALALARAAAAPRIVGETPDAAAASIVDLVLPTDNVALFRGGGPEFYQYIERDYHGVKSTPWEGGQYGFVCAPMETGAGLIYTRFHEGIDIAPLQRD